MKTFLCLFSLLFYLKCPAQNISIVNTSVPKSKYIFVERGGSFLLQVRIKIRYLIKSVRAVYF